MKRPRKVPNHDRCRLQLPKRESGDSEPLHASAYQPGSQLLLAHWGDCYSATTGL